MKITKELLERHNACEDQVDLFISLFPEGTEVTEESCLKAVEGGIDFEWACCNLLKNQDAYEAARKPLWDAYDAAVKAFRDAYNAAVKPFWDDYNAAIKPLRDAYIAAIKPLRDAYIAAKKPFLDAYNAARKPLLEEYKKQQALVFCKQFNEENPQ